MLTSHLRRSALALLATLALAGCAPQQPPPAAASADGYLFCFWNTENLFDDKEDHHGNDDREYDEWFAHDDADRKLKYAHLSEAIVKLNDGKGPDILAVVEVESIRAAELLRDALNDRLKDSSLHYTHVLMKEVSAGRHIAPAILTRLPVEGNRTRLLTPNLRILEAHIVVNDHDLIVIASHWTSRRTDRSEEGSHRGKYGDQIYGAFKGMYQSNPRVDLLVCGDFNDTPTDDSVVKHLHAIGDANRVRKSDDEPFLYDLMADKDAEEGFGTHFYHNKWFIFDQICVSPALLAGDGWSVVPNSVQTINTLVEAHDKHKRPWRFGNPKDKAERGYSDHFPVTVRLKVAGK